MRIDLSNTGYKYYSYAARRKHVLEWLGTVENDAGELGALALNPSTGAYIMFAAGQKTIELEPMRVLQALSDPVKLSPPGRPAGARGVERMRSVTLNDKVCEAGRIMGNGNLSMGVRLAVEYASMHEDEFRAWASAVHGHPDDRYK